jgi:cyclic AMP-responsive element-binding protein 3
MIYVLFLFSIRDSPDYQALSPALSSPGPSISERGGSPQRYIQVIHNSPSSSPKQPQTPQPIYIQNSKIVSSAAFKKYNKSPPKVVVEKINNADDGLMFNKEMGQHHVQQHPQIMNVKTLSAKEVKIYRVASTANNINYLTPATTTTMANSQHNKINGKKVTAIQFKNGSKTRTVSTTNGDAMVMSKGVANGVGGNLNGVRKVIRVQNNPSNPRSILLPVAFQDIKDLRTIKIVNASSLNKKSPNIKLAAANMLQQSKQGLMPKNMIVTKDQLIEDSTSMSDHTSGSDGESFVFEEMLQQQQQQQYRQQPRPSVMDDDDEDDEDDDGEFLNAFFVCSFFY